MQLEYTRYQSRAEALASRQTLSPLPMQIVVSLDGPCVEEEAEAQEE